MYEAIPNWPCFLPVLSTTTPYTNPRFLSFILLILMASLVAGMVMLANDSNCASAEVIERRGETALIGGLVGNLASHSALISVSETLFFEDMSRIIDGSWLDLKFRKKFSLTVGDVLVCMILF